MATRGRKHRNSSLIIALGAVAVVALSLAFGGDLVGGSSKPALAEGSLLQAVVLDVGQGDSIILISGGHSMLIDAGENDRGDEVVAALRSLGVERLDAVVGTHPHSDHIGGLDTVLRAFPADALYMPAMAANTETYEDVLDAAKHAGVQVTVPRPGDRLSLGQAELTFLWPPEDYDADNANDHSIVLRAEAGGRSLLLCGDLEAGPERALIEGGAAVRCDVLKVAHHGSGTSTTGDFLAAARPDYALISVGRGNEYGHPDGDVVERLEDEGCTVLRTDRDGDITVVVDGEGLHVSGGR